MVTVYRRLSGIFITLADPIRPSSNTISPSESGARKQRLRGVYANVHSANVLCTSTKKKAAFFNSSPLSVYQSKAFCWPWHFQATFVRLLRPEFSTIHHSWHSEGIDKDKTSMIERHWMKVTAVVSRKRLTGNVSAFSFTAERSFLN